MTLTQERRSAADVTFERPPDYGHEITARADRVRFLHVPRRRYFTIDGADLPGSPGFVAAIGTLYPIAYTVHFGLKRRGIDAPVGALEGLWWAEPDRPISIERFRATSAGVTPLSWRLLLPGPDAATDDDLAAAIQAVSAKKRPARLDDLRFEAWEEGTAAQVMHVGAYADEPATIERLHAAIADAGLRPRGCHHEIYISDPNRTDPEKMKTLLRQPVEAVAP